MSKKVIGEIKIEITENDIESIIVGSFEGGSNYWLGLNNTGEDWGVKPKSEPSSIWAVKLLLEGKTVSLYDIEDESEEWELTLDKILAGIAMNQKKRPHDCNIEDGDAETMDCIIQYALFNQLVYG